MKFFAAALGLLAITSMATAQTVTLDSTGNTYGTSLNFDETGTTTGAVTGNEWNTDPWNITITPRQGPAWVNDYTTGGIMDAAGNPGGAGGTIGQGNSFGANWGQIITFDAPVESFSAQVWNSAPGSFLGGFGVFLFLDGAPVGTGILPGPGVSAEWNDSGDTWVNISADGVLFNEISLADTRFSGADVVYMDNLSWNLVPAPGAFALLGLAGLARRRRRQA